jgi:plasmid stabilization system protein ParE
VITKVIFAPRFGQDLRLQTLYLESEGKPTWADRLVDEVAEIEKLLTAFPEAGQTDHLRGTRALRRVTLRCLPFFVWYEHQPRKKRVIVLHLLHQRQRR